MSHYTEKLKCQNTEVLSQNNNYYYYVGSHNFRVTVSEECCIFTQAFP